MTMKSAKTTKYTTSDGRIFIGSDQRKFAVDHEKLIQKRIEEYQHNLNIANILGEAGIFSEWEVRDVMNGAVDVEEDFKDLMDQLFGGTTCPEDLEDFRELATMIRDTVDNLGGLDVIKKLYDYATKNL